MSGPSHVASGAHLCRYVGPDLKGRGCKSFHHGDGQSIRKYCLVALLNNTIRIDVNWHWRLQIWHLKRRFVWQWSAIFEQGIPEHLEKTGHLLKVSGISIYAGEHRAREV